MALATVVLGAIFGLLAKGIRTPQAETEKANLKAEIRGTLQQISADVLLAGTDLPPEFPAFTLPGVNPEVANVGGPDAIEIVGNLNQSGASMGEPAQVESFEVRPDRLVAKLGTNATHIGQGDLVLAYDDAPTEGTWIFGLVSSVRGGELELKTQPYDREGAVELPWYINNYNRPLPTSGFVTPVTVVTYFVPDPLSGLVSGDEERVLLRRVNWGKAQEVAYVEDLQIRYFIGSTIDEDTVPGPDDITPPGPHIRPQRVEPLGGPPGISERGGKPPGKPGGSHNPPGNPGGSRTANGNADETEVDSPPPPQPDPFAPLVTRNVVRGVRISVTGRSETANLEGSTVRPGESTQANGYHRATFTTRVAARNLLFRVSSRSNARAFN